MPKTVPPVVPAGRMAAMDQPVIEAPGGLRLRRLEAQDAGTLVRAFADPAIRHYHGRSFESVDEAIEFVQSTHEGWSGEKTAAWAVEQADGTMAGRVGLSFIDLEHGIAEISYWVLPEARGRGVSVAAASALVDWAFDVLGVHRLEIVHSMTNAASCAVAATLGFAVEGTLRSCLLHDDGWHDMHLHSRIRSE